jgi:hypothetical protein
MSGEVRAAVIAAAREFNNGRYFEAHEALEEALDDVPDEQWDLFLGLIQIAVGYHKITQGLFGGAKRMLRIGLAKVDDLPDDFGGLNLGDLRERARRDHDALDAQAFDEAAFREDPPRLQPRPR